MTLRAIAAAGMTVRAIAAAGMTLFAFAASAQTYPNAPIKVIVPFTPGTGMDILARTLGQKLSERWASPVVVENKPGASGNIGTDSVAKAPPDGYTLLVTANTIVLNRSLFKSIPYDPVKDFEPVLPLALGKMVLVVNPKIEATSVDDLVALARKSPGRIDYGSPGRGTPHHLAMELFKQMKGVDLLHVPYKGTGPAVTDLVGGQIAVMFLPIHVAQPQIDGGKLRMLQGLRDIDVDIWYALYAPARTPREVVAKLNAEMNAILQLPEIRETLSKQGLVATGGSASDLAKLTAGDMERWAKVIRDARLEAE
jgi:tripartite-type tricarboxylate transporter receptor subunit TctC